MITVDKSVNKNQVNKIKSISHVRIYWEKYRNNKLDLQCLNRQKFGHNRSNCYKDPKCVKCLGKHKTTDCDKDDNSLPQCTNCESQQPANYSGCIKFKEAIIKNTKNNNKFKLSRITCDGVIHPPQNLASCNQDKYKSITWLVQAPIGVIRAPIPG